MEWDLVCERKGLRATAQSLFMVGVLAGSYLFGWLSDKMGRKVSFFISVVVMAVFGLLSGLVPEYWSFVVMRMVVGAATSGVFLVAYVLAMEMVGPRYRVMAGTLCQYYYTAGYIFMAAVAFSLNQDWHLLQVVLSLPCLSLLQSQLSHPPTGSSRTVPLEASGSSRNPVLYSTLPSVQF